MLSVCECHHRGWKLSPSLPDSPYVMCFRVLVPKAFPLPISAVFKLVKALIPSSLEIFFFFFFLANPGSWGPLPTHSSSYWAIGYLPEVCLVSHSCTFLTPHQLPNSGKFLALWIQGTINLLLMLWLGPRRQQCALHRRWLTPASHQRTGVAPVPRRAWRRKGHRLSGRADIRTRASGSRGRSPHHLCIPSYSVLLWGDF